MDWSNLIDTSKLAGWARSLVAAGLGVAVAKWPWLATVMDPSTQAAVGTVVAGVVVGAWSHLAKSAAPAAPVPPAK